MDSSTPVHGLVTVQATHSGNVRLGNVEYPCFILEDGRRMLSQHVLMRAIGITGNNTAALYRGAKTSKKTDVRKLGKTTPSEGQNDQETGAISRFPKLQIRPPGAGRLVYGFEVAQVLDFLRDWQGRLIRGELRKNQRHIGEAAANLLASLAGVGIEAMVDEACGYSPKETRQDALDRWLRRDRNKSEKSILSERFMSEMCRLHGWTFVPGQRPPKLMIGVAGKFYQCVLGGPRYVEFKSACDKDIVRPDGVRSEMFQFLTNDALSFMHVNGAVASAIASDSSSAREFWRRFAAETDGTGFQMRLQF